MSILENKGIKRLEGKKKGGSNEMEKGAGSRYAHHVQGLWEEGGEHDGCVLY